MSLRAARLNAGLRVEDLAAEVGVKPGSVWYWERGGAPKDARVAKRVADFFGVQVTDLWSVDEGGRERSAA